MPIYLALNLLTIHSPTRSSTRWPGKDAINILIRNIYSLYLLLFTKTCSEKFNCSCRFFSRTVRSNMVDSPPTYTSEHEYITLEAANNLSYFTRSLPPVPRNCPTPMGVAGKGAHDWFKCHRVIFLSRVAGLYFDFEYPMSKYHDRNTGLKKAQNRFWLALPLPDQPIIVDSASPWN